MKKNHIHTMLTMIALIVTSFAVNGQRFDQLDAHPLDIAYFKQGEESRPKVKVVYGRPAANDDEVFGTQVPFGEVWHTGSNESTEVQFFCDVMFGNKFVSAGKYVLYTIPDKNYWTVILNSKTDTYGAYFYDPEYNVASIKVPVTRGRRMDNFSIAFNDKDYGTQMILAFARTRVKIPLYTEESLISKI